MKKIIFIALISIANTANAQLIKKINAGAFVSTAASTTFSDRNKPFVVGYNLSPSVVFITKKTFHNVFYGFGNNSINSLNGYFLKNNWDVYLVGSKSLNNKSKYLGAGIEKMEKIGNVKFFEFCELGTAFDHRPILTLGLLVNVSWTIK